MNESKINFFYLDPPIQKKYKDILISFSLKKILEKNVLGIIENPVDTELNNLEGYEIWLKKKYLNLVLFY